MTDQPTPQELTAIAARLARIADLDMATATPDNRTGFYARCVIHAAAMNLRSAANRIDTPPNMATMAAASASNAAATERDNADVEYVMSCARRTLTAEHTIILGDN